MKEILNFHFRVDHFIDDFDTWENKTAEHDDLAEAPLQESVLATCLYSATSGALRALGPAPGQVQRLGGLERDCHELLHCKGECET